MEKLKPCPFCGGNAKFEQTAHGTTDANSCQLVFSIRCVKCGATAPGAHGYISIKLAGDGELNPWHDDRSSATEDWNRRAE